MTILKLIPLIGLFSFQATTAAADNALSTPVVDGKCVEYTGLPNSTSTDLGSNVTLFSYQNKDYVWFCYTKNKRSYAVMDLYIDAPNLPEALMLHISARIGEWPANKPELRPGRNDSWWDVEGWWAQAALYNGLQENDEGVLRPKFKPGIGREMVFSKARFGRGDWKLHFQINHVLVGDEPVNLNYPEQPDEGRATITFKAS